MRKIDAYRKMKSGRDANLKVLRHQEALKKKIKAQRKAYNEKIKRQQARLEAKARPDGDHKLQKKLTDKQIRRRNKQVKRNIAKRKKLKYQDNKGDIALRAIVDKEQWQSGFHSSNVWRFKIKGKNLLVSFLDGSTYIYFGAARLFLGLFRAGSKGKFIWRNLRRKNINYLKIT